MSGESILNSAKQELEGVCEDQLKQFLMSTLNEVRRRKGWIKVRTDQINQLEALQLKAVKSFDEGTFNEMKPLFEKELQDIQVEKIQQTSKQRGYNKPLNHDGDDL